MTGSASELVTPAATAAPAITAKAASEGFFLGLGLVHREGTAAHFFAINLCDRGVGGRCIGELDESEALGLTAEFVTDDGD